MVQFHRLHVPIWDPTPVAQISYLVGGCVRRVMREGEGGSEEDERRGGRGVRRMRGGEGGRKGRERGRETRGGEGRKRTGREGGGKRERKGS